MTGQGLSSRIQEEVCFTSVPLKCNCQYMSCPVSLSQLSWSESQGTPWAGHPVCNRSNTERLTAIHAHIHTYSQFLQSPSPSFLSLSMKESHTCMKQQSAVSGMERENRVIPSCFLYGFICPAVHVVKSSL